MGMPDIVSNNIDRFDSITDIIQSVALEQAALAHILNAEGEKIQKVVAMEGATTEELFKTNKSVNCLVDTITRLEMLLHSKLALFDKCLDVCVKDCKKLVDTFINFSGDPGDKTFNITKINKNEFTIDITYHGELPMTFDISTAPNLPLVAKQLPDTFEFNNNKLIVPDTNISYGEHEIVLTAGSNECLEDIIITTIVPS